jgi:hypothetical protein
MSTHARFLFLVALFLALTVVQALLCWWTGQLVWAQHVPPSCEQQVLTTYQALVTDKLLTEQSGAPSATTQIQAMESRLRMDANKLILRQATEDNWLSAVEQNRVLQQRLGDLQKELDTLKNGTAAK